MLNWRLFISKRDVYSCLLLGLFVIRNSVQSWAWSKRHIWTHGENYRREFEGATNLSSGILYPGFANIIPNAIMEKVSDTR